ncbi:MAG TPA: ATP-binding protein [Chroococcales cyanobacterium]
MARSDGQQNSLLSLDEEQLRLVIDAAPNGLLMVDASGAIVMANTQVEKLFLYSKEELLSQSVEMLVPAGAREKHPSYRESFAREHAPRAMGAGRDLYGQRKDGVQIPVEIGLNPIKTSKGNFVIASIVDITERKLKDEALQRSVLELQRSNDDLQQFAYVCSHDLQEPLRVISNYTQLIERRYKGTLDENADDFIHFIVDATRRMQELINDLLVYSRVQSRAQELRITDCNAALNTAKANLALSIEETKAVITADPLPEVMGDNSQLAQLFQNLLGNAIKFRGPKSPHVEIRVQPHGKYWQFSVKDNGIGFEMKYADRIFVIFQRLHAREDYPGSGIGLAICKKIVERHGGQLDVSSAPNEGTEFTFTIPKVARSSMHA